MGTTSSNIREAQAAGMLASEGLWEDVFEGTKFALYGVVWNSENNPSSGFDITKGRWITGAVVQSSFPEGFIWGTTHEIHSQFIGVKSVSEDKISFMPAYDKTQSLVAHSVSTGNTNRMAVINSNIADEANQWTMTYRTVERGDLIVDINIKNPTEPLVDGTIGTIPLGSGSNPFAVYIIDPGPKLLAKHCLTSPYTNLTSAQCVTFCGSHSDACINVQQTFCADPTDGYANLRSSYCQNFCMDDLRADCDAELKTFCAGELSREGNDVSKLISGPYSNMCSCFLPASTMNGYGEQVNSQFNVQVDTNSETCFYPPCSTNAQAIPTFHNKSFCGTCPKTSGCILDADINFEGKFVKPPTVSKSKACKDYNKLAISIVDEPKPTTPFRCDEPDQPPIIPKEEVSFAKYAIITIAGFSVVCVIAAVVYHSTKKTKNTKPV